MKLSNTNQRRIIIEELRNLYTHPTADELYVIVREKLPQISLGTVYRNLELLADAGKVLKLELSGKQKRFDGNVNKHFHMRCRACGRIEDMHADKMSEIDRNLNDLVDKLKVDGYRLELNGLCNKCRAEEE
ncbi:MAG: hypothetical protein A2020_01470 [Lentisphaerae bacterium GWF2_45_14]|nr:MAG: hypothetical protein A2020_01470 [Lentisphaerae bacterium GWF2_45_14]